MAPGRKGQSIGLKVNGHVENWTIKKLEVDGLRKWTALESKAQKQDCSL